MKSNFQRFQCVNNCVRRRFMLVNGNREEKHPVKTSVVCCVSRCMTLRYVLKKYHKIPTRKEEKKSPEN